MLDLKYNYTLDNDANNNGPKTGQLTGITDLKNQARNRAYEYDKLGRLSKVKGGINAFTTPNWYQTYSYDRYGNRSLVQLTALGMAPVKPGSQSRSDLIGKIGPGAGGAANRIFSADDPFAALGINEGYGSTTAGFSDSDSAGTHVRGGPRVTAEEYSNAPSANVVGRELLAKHPAGAQLAKPHKEYGRSRRSIVTVTPLSSNIVSPNAYQTPDSTQGFAVAVNTPSNIGHAQTSLAVSELGVNQTSTCRWFNFSSVSGTIVSIKLKIDHDTDGFLNGIGSVNSFSLQYSLDGGSSWTVALARSQFSERQIGTLSIDLPTTQNISLVQVRDYIQAGTILFNSSAYASATIGNIRLEVETDTTAPAISNVAAGGITSTGATITWTTNENSDSQVEYGTTTSYGQSTTLNPTLVTAHSQALSGLNSDTLYHYRVKSKDAAGNLAMSADFTFRTLDATPPGISNVATEGITASSATITWTTNENSDSQLEYGPTTAYGQSTALNPALVTAHSQGLSGLTAGTLYHYRVKSRDAAGNLAVCHLQRRRGRHYQHERNNYLDHK